MYYDRQDLLICRITFKLILNRLLMEKHTGMIDSNGTPGSIWIMCFIGVFHISD